MHNAADGRVLVPSITRLRATTAGCVTKACSLSVPRVTGKWNRVSGDDVGSGVQVHELFITLETLVASLGLLVRPFDRLD